MSKSGDSEDYVVDDGVDREGCYQSCEHEQTATFPWIGPGLFDAVFHETIFCDGPIKLSEALPVLGRSRVVRWLQHEAPIQKKYCFKIATLSRISGLNVTILTQKVMAAKWPQLS